MIGAWNWNKRTMFIWLRLIIIINLCWLINVYSHNNLLRNLIWFSFGKALPHLINCLLLYSLEYNVYGLYLFIYRILLYQRVIIVPNDIRIFLNKGLLNSIFDIFNNFFFFQNHVIFFSNAIHVLKILFVVQMESPTPTAVS